MDLAGGRDIVETDGNKVGDHLIENGATSGNGNDEGDVLRMNDRFVDKKSHPSNSRRRHR